MRDDILDFIKEVQAISHIGQQYSTDPYAIDNYSQLQSLSAQMLAKYSQQQIIKRDMYVDYEYPTPQPAVRTLVFNQTDNKMLFVQERDSGLWSLPGGWIDVNSTPALCAVKEVEEESGYECDVTRLLAVFDRNKYLERQSMYDILCFYFAAEVIGGEARPNHETMAVDWFDIDDLPPLSNKNTAKEITHAYTIWQKNKQTYCD